MYFSYYIALNWLNVEGQNIEVAGYKCGGGLAVCAPPLWPLS